MGRTGNDEIQPFPFPEEFAVQSLVVKQQLVVVQQLLCSIGGHSFQIIRVTDVGLIAHGFREHPTAVEAGAVVVEFLRAVALLPQQVSQRLPEIVGHIVKGVTALTAQK